MQVESGCTGLTSPNAVFDLRLWGMATQDLRGHAAPGPGQNGTTGLGRSSEKASWDLWVGEGGG